MSRVSRNIVFNFIGQGTIVALGFWGTRLVFSRLGDEALGILYFALAVYAVLTPIVDLGVSSTVVREVAAHRDLDRDYIATLIQTGTVFYWCSYSLLIAAIWVIAPWLVTHWISLTSLGANVAIHSLRILAAGLLLMLPRSLYANVLRGVERMEFNNAIEVATIALQQIGTIVAVSLGLGLVAISYCYLVSFFLSILAYVWMAHRFVPWRAFVPRVSRDVISRNFRFTSQVSAYSILAMIQMEADKALVSKFLPVGSLGFYGVAQTMVARVNRLPGAVTQAAFPTFSGLFHRGDHDGLLKEYRRLQDLVCYGLAPVFAGVIFFAQPVFRYLLNENAARVLLLPTAFLSVGWYMNATLNIPAILSLAVGRADIGARQNLYALFLVLPVTAWLIWRWGLVGAGLSSVFYHIYAYSYGARRIASECLGMRPISWYFHVLKIFGIAFATYGAGWSILALTRHSSIASLSLLYLAATLAFLFVSYMTMGEELRSGFGHWYGKLALGSLRVEHLN